MCALSSIQLISARPFLISRGGRPGSGGCIVLNTNVRNDWFAEGTTNMAPIKSANAHASVAAVVAGISAGSRAALVVRNRPTARKSATGKVLAKVEGSRRTPALTAAHSP